MKDLLVVTTYFDYFGSKYMLPNFEKFKAQVAKEGVDLVVYEAAVEDQPFRLDPAPNVFQLRSRHMLWQKERMVNLAIKRFGDQYKNIAWIDNDVVLSNGWSAKALGLLEEFPAVQLFSEIHYLLKDESVEKVVEGYVRKLYDRDFAPTMDASRSGNPGTAWACRTSVLKNLGIYDAYINCGSDTLFSITLSGERINWVAKMRRNPRGYNVLMNHYLNRHHGEWSRKFTKRLSQEVGEANPRRWVSFLDLPLRHLYHGRLQQRDYMIRHRILLEDGFDPKEDLKINEEGLYEWSTDKSRMQRRLMRIFRHGKVLPSYV